MEEQTTWKGHSFTLLVFTGIVVLCSIFFILGMLVGRAQGQKTATVAAAKPSTKGAAKADAAEEKPDLTFYESAVANAKIPEPVAPEPATPFEAGPLPEPDRPSNLLNYQIGALRKASDAEKLLNDVKKKGFRAFILAPPAGDANPFFRVQVGPFADVIEAEQAKKKLETAGYQPILKK